MKEEKTNRRRKGYRIRCSANEREKVDPLSVLSLFHLAERQGIRISHQVAEMKTLQSLRPMTASIPWHVPSPRPMSVEEQEIFDDLDSHVCLFYSRFLVLTCH